MNRLPQDETKELVGYLLTCSERSLQGVELDRLNQAANLRRDLREVLDELVEKAATARLANLLRRYGPELMGTPQRGVCVLQPELGERLLQGWLARAVRARDRSMSFRGGSVDAAELGGAPAGCSGRAGGSAAGKLER